MEPLFLFVRTSIKAAGDENQGRGHNSVSWPGWMRHELPLKGLVPRPGPVDQIVSTTRPHVFTGAESCSVRSRSVMSMTVFIGAVSS